MNILVINGPNMNMLGTRRPDIYGRKTYADLIACIEDHCRQAGIEVYCFQSNHEGAIIDIIQAAVGKYDAVVINAAAYTHTSIAIADALEAAALPAAEVHISDISAREDYRRVSFLRSACVFSVCGKGFDGYLQAVDFLCSYIKGQNKE